ncbi:hypothetical protein Droror1_Dr00013104 [Drosera rotundifolia]
MIVSSSVSMAMEKGDLRVRTKAPTTSTAEYSDDRDHGGEDDAAWMKETEEEEEEPLSPCGRLYHTPCLNTSVVILIGFATKVDVDVLKERMEKTLIRHPRVSSKLTVNDVIVGLTDAALSRYLHVMPGDHRRRKIRLRSNIAVNARKTVGVQDLVDMMENGSKCKWGNVTGCIMIPFDVTLEKDPLEHVRKAKLVIDRKKLSLEAKFTYYLTFLGAKDLGMKFLVSLFYRFISNTTLMLSTVTGPAEEVNFCGHRIAYICGSARTAGGYPPGLVIHYTSYMNKMSVAVCANQDLIPDPHKILDEVEESLKLMKNAVLQRKQSKNGLLST